MINFQKLIKTTGLALLVCSALCAGQIGCNKHKEIREDSLYTNGNY